MNLLARTVTLGLLVLSASACKNLAPPQHVTLPQVSAGSHIELNPGIVVHSYSGSEKVGELCSQTSGACFDQMQETSGTYAVPVVRPTLDGQPIDDAQIRAIMDPRRDERLAALPAKTSSCRIGRAFVLSGAAAAILGGLVMGKSAGSQGLAVGGIMLGVGAGAIAYGSIKGAWTCGRTVKEHDELDLDRYIGMTTIEGDAEIAEIKQLAERFNAQMTSNAAR